MQSTNSNEPTVITNQNDPSTLFSGSLNPKPASTDANENESIYALPKTLNGKTVTELFPEFQYDSVLRFSKLFGVGRATSLPKIWKGTRKRKKPKQPLNNNSNEINNNENKYLDSSSNNNYFNGNSTNNNNDDVFSLFDDAFNENKPEEKPRDKEAVPENYPSGEKLQTGDKMDTFVHSADKQKCSEAKTTGPESSEPTVAVQEPKQPGSGQPEDAQEKVNFVSHLF
jgi:hypothetical protein